jgi:DnaJ-class molecular chaperone
MKKKYILPGELFLRLFSHTYPEAHKYFIEYISKAYQALTDPISRENYEKYGHPDGRQVILASLDPNVSIRAKFCNTCSMNC